MDHEFGQFQTVPELTLEPFKKEEKETRTAAEPKAAVFDESMLSEGCGCIRRAD